MAKNKRSTEMLRVTPKVLKDWAIEEYYDDLDKKYTEKQVRHFLARHKPEEYHVPTHAEMTEFARVLSSFASDISDSAYELQDMCEDLNEMLTAGRLDLTDLDDLNETHDEIEQILDSYGNLMGSFKDARVARLAKNAAKKSSIKWFKVGK